MTLQRMVVLNAQECTIGQFVNVVDSTGWKLVFIRHSFTTRMASLVFDAMAV
jgi:hypothetical protein